MRLIDADELLAIMPTIEDEYKHARKMINNAPTVDPVKQGRWDAKWNTLFKAYLPCCSVCSKSAVYTFDYCPNCGAKMDGESNEMD